MHNFNSNDSKAEKVALELINMWHVAGHHMVTPAVRGKGLKACSQVSIWVHKPRWHVST